MTRRGPYPQEVRERAVRLVFAQQDSHDSQWAAIRSVADKIGCTAETVRNWVRQAETDEGRRPGPTSEELDELKQLRRDNAELRRANEMAGSGGGSNDLRVGL